MLNHKKPVALSLMIFETVLCALFAVYVYGKHICSSKPMVFAHCIASCVLQQYTVILNNCIVFFASTACTHMHGVRIM